VMLPSRHGVEWERGDMRHTLFFATMRYCNLFPTSEKLSHCMAVRYLLISDWEYS